MRSEVRREHWSSKMSGVLTSQLFGDESAARNFMIIVRRGGFELAARSLGLSTDVLRAEMTKLEGRLKMQLFYLTGDRVKLTDDGEELYQLTEAFFSGPTATELYGEQSDLVISIPTILLEGFLYRDLIFALRAHSGARISLTDDESDCQRSADVVVWLEEPGTYNALHRTLTKTKHLTTVNFSLYVKERRLRGRETPEVLSDLDEYMTAQYAGYERFACFSQWNDYVTQRKCNSIYTETPQALWHMIRWVGCVGLLPDSATYLKNGVKQLPRLLDKNMELEVWIGLSKQSGNDPEVRMLLTSLTRAFNR